MKILYKPDEVARETVYVSDSASVLLQAMQETKDSFPPSSKLNMDLRIGDYRFNLAFGEFESILRKAI